ncbi:RHS repeat-associated core domain-containing protein, partial [Serratia marcescens]|uniref:RHS repeat-associated core domain-containing protein n=1 Tax=Serratia marcescens TaxID=615 RepID=UPI003204AC6F
TTRFLWQGYRLLQEQRDDGSRRSWSYDPASPWSPLAALEQAGDSRSADIYWYHTDLNSAPLEVADAAGNLCWSGQYDTFGKLQGQTVAGAAKRQGAQYQQPLRYAGQYQDDESGLHYNLFRYYEPEVGRFTTQDPIGLRGGLNLYQYAPNPLMWVDPLGLSSKPCKTEETTRVRHYTNRKGSNAIEESGVIKAQDNGRVYVEPANKKPMSQVQAENKYQIKPGRGRDYVETDVPNSQLEWITNPRYHTQELTVKGDVPLKNPTVTKRK